MVSETQDDQDKETAVPDLVEIAIKRQGEKYYERLFQSIISDRTFIVDTEDLRELLTMGRMIRGIEYTIHHMFLMIHTQDCHRPHRIRWTCGKFTGTIVLSNTSMRVE